MAAFSSAENPSDFFVLFFAVGLILLLSFVEPLSS
jgi:hypothetical protein